MLMIQSPPSEILRGPRPCDDVLESSHSSSDDASSSRGRGEPSSSPPLTQPVRGQQPQGGDMNGLRRGKWTVEEERFVKRIIHDFNNGTLEAAPGTTLRNYLSEKLNCDPMRITKKFTGEDSIGKRVFHPVENDADAVDAARREVAALEAQWHRKLQSMAKEADPPQKRKSTSDDDSEKRRRLDSVETKRYEAWLARARALVESEDEPRIVSEIDALLEQGHRLRRDLSDDQPTTMEDDEATSLLVDFLRSAQQQLG